MVLRAVVFDVSGTILDEGCTATLKSVQWVLKDRGFQFTDSEVSRFVGLSNRDHISSLLDTLSPPWKYTDQDLDQLCTKLRARLRRRVVKPLIPGARAVIQWCKDKGLKVGLTTEYDWSTFKPVQEYLAKEGIVVDAIACATDVPEGRPAPWTFLEVVKRMGVYPLSSVVKIGDSPFAMASGKNAGVLGIGVLTGTALEKDLLGSGADFVVPGVSGVPAILQGLLEVAVV